MGELHMMRVLVTTSVRFRLLVIGLAGALLLIGATQLQHARVDVLPEFTPPYVEVQTEALGLSAEEVEELVTVPLEADLLHGVAFLAEIRSQSLAGLSSIVLIFEPGTDIFEARQVVAERLTQAHALPNVAKAPVMLQPLSSLSRFMIVGLRSDEKSLIEMSVLARWNIRPRLMGVPGVANVSIFGQRERQLQVLVDPTELDRHGVSLEQVVETAGNALWFSPLTFLEASTPGTGGFIDTPQQRLGIQHVLPIRSADDLANVAIEPEEGASPLRIGDVATVVEDHQPLIGDGLVGDGAGLLLVLEKFPDVNTLDVTRDVEAAFEALTPGLGGIQIDTTVFREASFIDASIGNVSLAVIIGFLLIAVILGALLFDWRAALISLVTIPLSLLAAGFVLHQAGASINALTLAGLFIAIGVIIDDAGGVVDDVLRRLRDPRDGDAERGKAAVVAEAVLEGRTPVVYATFVILVGLVPLLFVAGAVSAFLPSLAFAYAAAILASMAVAATVAPALAVLILVRASSERRESPLLRRARAAYRTSLAGLLRRARPTAVAAAVLVVGAALVLGVMVAPSDGDSLLPTFRQRDLLIHWDGAPGTSREAMNRTVSRAGAELRAIPGVRNVGGHVGRAILSDEQSSVNAAEIWVSMDPNADYESTLTAIESTVSGYPGLDRAVTTYTSDRVDEVLAGTGSDVAIRIYGQDLSVLEAKAEEVRAAMSEVSGISSPSATVQVMEPTLEIEVDLEAAALREIKAGDIRRAAASLLSGIQVGNLFEDQKVFEVVVWGTPDLRHSLSSVEDLMIDTPNQGLVRLGDVASVRVQPSPSVITREGVMRYIDVSADVSGRDLGAVLGDLQASLAAIPFAIEYHAEISSPALERQSDQFRLFAVLAGAAILALLVLQAAFGSWRLALLVLLALPAAAVGGALATLATGDLVSMGSLAGLITVIAITVRQAVTLVHRFRALERTSGGVSGIDLAIAGAQERLAPTLITALGTAAFAMPFIALGDVAGLEIMRPMAVFLLGGLISSTVLVLFILPIVYLRSGPSPASETESLWSESPAFEPTPA
jgi:CzcA family heavy metal efflux pump